jgi:hypothetical protein
MEIEEKEEGSKNRKLTEYLWELYGTFQPPEY